MSACKRGLVRWSRHFDWDVEDCCSILGINSWIRRLLVLLERIRNFKHCSLTVCLSSLAFLDRCASVLRGEDSSKLLTSWDILVMNVEYAPRWNNSILFLSRMPVEPPGTNPTLSWHLRGSACSLKECEVDVLDLLIYASNDPYRVSNLIDNHWQAVLLWSPFGAVFLSASLH